MVSIQLKTHVGSDGILTLRVPTEFRETEVEALLVLQPVAPDSLETPDESKGWPSGFFESVAGSIQDETFQRWPQGEYEVREAL
jgi:hypothetical protein